MLVSASIIYLSFATALAGTISPAERANAPDVRCGAGDNTKLSTCQYLLNDIWSAEVDRYKQFPAPVLEFKNKPLAGKTILKAKKVACSNLGGCCVFSSPRVSGGYVNEDPEVIKQQALSLLGCADTKEGLVSVLGNFGGQSVCVASDDSGDGCFTGNAFDPEKGSWDYP